MAGKVYSVTELNRKVRVYLEDNFDLANIYITGEMSNITYYKSGHLYFTLKDKNASVKCASFMFKMKKIPDNLKEGEQVKVFGSVTLYEGSGQYQFLVDFLERVNQKGELYIKFEELKKKLLELGYFDENRKKKLPKLPRNIGVVTAATGAAVRDIINTARKRFPNINIYVYPAKVQGDGSEAEIARGIEVLNSIECIDIIIAGRGGGSIEDLWSFNSEIVADAFYNSKKPIISAVGHEIDFVISDFVADVRAATPTQAAEICVPEKSVLISQLENREKRLKLYMENMMRRKKREIESAKNSFVIRNYDKYMLQKREKLIENERLLESVLERLLAKEREKVSHIEQRLTALNPKAVLMRGYSITQKNGKTVKSFTELHNGDIIDNLFYDGEVKSIVSRQEKLF